MVVIAIGSDHGGYNYKETIKKYLEENEYQVIDVGTTSTDSCDYPIYAKKVADLVAKNEVEKGILICGTGIGMCITANKIKGIRAALCSDTFSASATRKHNDSNILCLGERVLDKNLAVQIVDIWLNTEFEGGRHQRRIDMIE